MVEFRDRKGWRLVGDEVVRLLETASLNLRGFAPGEVVRIGPLCIPADQAGEVAVRFSDHRELDCHVGQLRVEAPSWKGEVEILPGKMSRLAYQQLRADLEGTWSGLALQDDAPTSLRAVGPDALSLWRRLGPAVDDIRREPLRRIEPITTYVRLDRVRRSCEMTPAVLVAGRKGLPARARTLGLVSAWREHAFVADTLRRLLALASRQPNAQVVTTSILPWLQRPPFDIAELPPNPTTLHALRFDKRFRLVHQIRRLLDHPSAVMTEGPGELRLGIRGLNRLYEYWVYLRVLQVASLALGPPAPPGFAVLARRLVNGKLRLELEAGTTVRFPGGWSVAFEPTITRNAASSWHGLEYFEHPHPEFRRTHLTPDICMFRDGTPPALWIVDAKYRARHLIDAALTEAHAIYGRIAWRGRGIVESVVVAHPHASLDLAWAGQTALPFIPGAPLPLLSWLPAAPCPVVAREASAAPATPTHVPTAGAPISEDRAAPVVPIPLSTPPTAAPVSVVPPTPPSQHQTPSAPIQVLSVRRPSDVVVILVDQTWMREHLGDRRIDLAAFGRRIARSRRFETIVVAPDLPALQGFFAAIAKRGGQVERTGFSRPSQVARLRELCEQYLDQEIYIVSGLDDFIQAARSVTPVNVIDSL